MNQRLSWIAWGLLAWGLAGCQCCGLTECYQDKIDCIADHTLCLDRCYHPTWDLSRIGYPDWCAGPINHWCYGDCCRCCRQQPPYDHMPLYVPGMEPAGRRPHEIPAVPPVEPAGEVPPSNLIGPSIVPTPEQLNQPSVIPDPRELNVAPPAEFPPAAKPPEFPQPPQPAPLPDPMPEALRDSFFAPASHSEPAAPETTPAAGSEGQAVKAPLPDPRDAAFEWVSQPKVSRASNAKDSPRFDPVKAPVKSAAK